MKLADHHLRIPAKVAQAISRLDWAGPGITLKQLAVAFDVSVRAVRHWQWAGLLPPPVERVPMIRWRCGDLSAHFVDLIERRDKAAK